MQYTLKDGSVLDVEAAVPEDAEALLRYAKQVGGETDNLLLDKNGLPLTPQQEAAYIRSVAAQKNAVMYCGRAGRQLVAVASLSTPASRRIAHTSELGISVVKEYWGRGVGSAMMQALLDFAKSTGSIRMIHLGVRAANQSAIALYRKFGFVQTGVRPGFFVINGRAEDEIIMCLSLA